MESKIGFWNKYQVTTMAFFRFSQQAILRIDVFDVEFQRCSFKEEERNNNNFITLFYDSVVVHRRAQHLITSNKKIYFNCGLKGSSKCR